MGNVSIGQLKSGERLADSVLTRRGNVLLEKGRTVTSRDIEILRAFLITSVSIDAKADAEQSVQETVSANDEDETQSNFALSFDNMVLLLKKVFNYANTGHAIPILEVRVQLEALIKGIDSYNILTFSPKRSGEQDYLYYNSVLVSLTSYQLAKWHGFQQKDWLPIALGGLFHDIGNVKIDEAILGKTSQLTEAEMEEVKKHTVYGYQLLKNLPAINEGVKLCTLQHHEKEDGSGYPFGVKGDKVHAYAKVVAIADIFHAMTSHRRHKKASSPYLVLEQVLKESFGKLDPSMVQTFITRVTSLHNGTLVKLSDNRIGEIIFSDRANPTRPWVNVNGAIVNLTTERNLFIMEVLEKRN
ncbi:HD-GYP domain-containing protein [Paenibacillus contaminans]|uniref:HD-GYP domain-containing protein n=1 Tax=Paenibacillus contaminans TaxID=450362 RepID=A0A329MJ02_9BACL|nr:HD-GYP domain-containing protein [Paenibacillus contaminans]RAV19538.1 HD-GYP domain-containing protein [Paenibacillus contaminans]